MSDNNSKDLRLNRTRNPAVAATPGTGNEISRCLGRLSFEAASATSAWRNTRLAPDPAQEVRVRAWRSAACVTALLCLTSGQSPGHDMAPRTPFIVHEMRYGPRSNDAPSTRLRRTSHATAMDCPTCAGNGLVIPDDAQSG